MADDEKAGQKKKRTPRARSYGWAKIAGAADKFCGRIGPGSVADGIPAPPLGGPDDVVLVLRNTGMDGIVAAETECVEQGEPGAPHALLCIYGDAVVPTEVVVEPTRKLEQMPLLDALNDA